MELDKKVLARAFALSTAILWTLCSIFIYVLPDISFTITKWWMHGMDIEVLGAWNLSLPNFVLGGVTLVVSAWIAGYILGWSWERVSK